MPFMTLKNLLQTVFIDELGEVVVKHPYIAFITMGNGIEILGKCLSSSSLDEENVSRKRFEDAIENLSAFAPYRPLIGKTNNFDLYKSLRCGLTHTLIPKAPVTLSSKGEMSHLIFYGTPSRVNLRCENFYEDFKMACDEIFCMSGDVAYKLSQVVLNVPDNHLNGEESDASIIHTSDDTPSASGCVIFPSS